MRLIDADELIKKLDEQIQMPTFMDCLSAINTAPTIEPKRGEWIPCSERLPSGEDAVLVSTCAFDAIYDVVFMMAKDVERFYECGYVNAWMPSPEPWEGADDESINFK